MKEKKSTLVIEFDVKTIEPAIASADDLCKVHLDVPMGDIRSIDCGDSIFTIEANPADDAEQDVVPSTFRYYAVKETQVHTKSILPKPGFITLNGNLHIPNEGVTKMQPLESAFFFDKNIAVAVAGALAREEFKRIQKRKAKLDKISDMVEDQIKRNLF